MSGDLFDEILRDIPPEPSHGPGRRLGLVYLASAVLYAAAQWLKERTSR